ncbi:MAG: ribose 5-phosphate isomerase B [Myxococcales bacterium]|nr:ribose 5-phosphate isomerase B [Myxococcales bacterium]
MRIALASDHAAIELRTFLAEHLHSLGHDVEDLGCDPDQRVDYPDYAGAAAGAVMTGAADKAVLLCGTGIGMSIAANKIVGIRAALVHDVTTARLAGEHNAANILCIGARVVGPLVAAECVDAWLGAAFDARHQRRLDKIAAME